MRLFITPSIFLSVIQDREANTYSCLPMELIHGMGMISATIYHPIQHDVVSAVLGDYTPKHFHSMEDVCKYHQELFALFNI